MVKVMPKKSDNIYHIISARKKVIMSFKILKRINEATKSYRLFFILIVRKLEKKDERTIGGRHGATSGNMPLDFLLALKLLKKTLDFG